MIRIKYYHILFFLTTINLNSQKIADSLKGFKINDLEYLEMRGANVMLAHDFYPESHQGGVGIIQNGFRIATNGDLRLEPAPGQWQPVPKVGVRQVDLKNQVKPSSTLGVISHSTAFLVFPDGTKDLTINQPLLCIALPSNNSNFDSGTRLLISRVCAGKSGAITSF